MRLLVTKRDSDLAGLKMTSHFVAEILIFERSLFITYAVFCGVSTIMYRLVSSANGLIFELMSLTMSFINIINNRGPSIEPCGKPAFR